MSRMECARMLVWRGRRGGRRGRKEAATRRVPSRDQKGKWWREGRKNSIEFVEQERGGFLLIYALKMPIDIYRYCHSRAARVSWLQPKLKLHFTVVFQVVAELSRNFNIPRRERLKIQTATCHSIATFHAIPSHSPSSFPSCFHLQSLPHVPLPVPTINRLYRRRNSNPLLLTLAPLTWSRTETCFFHAFNSFTESSLPFLLDCFVARPKLDK